MIELLGCMLPLQIDTSQIRVSKLVVRPHASEPGALVIDAIIHNRAPCKLLHPQPGH
jgi:hypothetical protein